MWAGRELAAGYTCFHTELVVGGSGVQSMVGVISVLDLLDI